MRPTRTMLASVFCICIALVTFAAPASSQFSPQFCAPRDVVVDRLKNEFAESRVMLGSAGRGTMMVETYANKASGSWTLVTTTPQQLSCMMIAGQNWYATKPVIVGLEF